MALWNCEFTVAPDRLALRESSLEGSQHVVRTRPTRTRLVVLMVAAAVLAMVVITLVSDPVRLVLRGLTLSFR